MLSAGGQSRHRRGLQPQEPGTTAGGKSGEGEEPERAGEGRSGQELQRTEGGGEGEAGAQQQGRMAEGQHP